MKRCDVIRYVTTRSLLLCLVACGARISLGVADDPVPPRFNPDPSFDAGDRDPPDSAMATRGCGDKECGAFCLPCDVDAASCGPPARFHVCNEMGSCEPAQPSCVTIQAVDASELYVPCAGLVCGASCTACDVSRAGCDGTIVGTCQANGHCAATTALCP